MRKFSDLRADQQTVIDTLFQRPKAFVVMRMGGGKTATFLTAFDELISEGYARRAIVIAPPLVAASVWPREPAKWEHLQNLKVVALTGSPAHRAKTLATTDADVITVSDGVVEWLVDHLDKLDDDDPLLDCIAYDEPKLKNPRGEIGKQLLRIADRVKNMWLMSGTPRPNGFEDLFMPSRLLTGDEVWGDDFDDWRRRHFMPMNFNCTVWEVHDFAVEKLTKQAAQFIVQAPEPPNAYGDGTLSSGPDFDVEIDLPPSARKLYRQMERDLLIELGVRPGADETEVIYALSQAVASSKLAQLAQGFAYNEDGEAYEVHKAKQDALARRLDEIGGDNSVIVYGFREDREAVQRLLDKQGRKYRTLGGASTSVKKKLEYCDEWNEGRLDNLLLHPASAGHGVELQFGGCYMTWYTPTWSPEQLDQTIKRLDRPGQTRHVVSGMLVTRDSVDEIKRNRTHFKMDDQKAFAAMLERMT